jgi:hypothetical protein
MLATIEIIIRVLMEVIKPVIPLLRILKNESAKGEPFANWIIHSIPLSLNEKLPAMSADFSTLYTSDSPSLLGPF